MTISKIATWTLAVIFLSGILVSCQKDEIKTVQDPGKYIVTKADSPMVYEFTTDLIAGQNLDVGDVIVNNDGENIYVTYLVLEPGWGMLQTHLHLATSLAGIPQTPKGNPKIGHFDYQLEHEMIQEYTYVIPLSWNPGTELFIAAHAVVAYDYMNAVVANLPSTAQLFLVYPHNMSYYQSIVEGGGIINGTYDGWCIEHGNTIIPNQSLPYNVNVLSSYEDISLLHNIDYPENLDKVNWLLNQNYVGQQSSCCGAFTIHDVQEAIWILVEDNPLIGYGNPQRVEEIINAAFDQGEGYVPNCDEFVAVILEPDDNSQISIILVAVADLVDNCDAQLETAWAAGLPFPGNSWAMYFMYTVSTP